MKRGTIDLEKLGPEAADPGPTNGEMGEVARSTGMEFNLWAERGDLVRSEGWKSLFVDCGMVMP
jgi:hypothetical protein